MAVRMVSSAKEVIPYLKGLQFPADKQTVIEHVKRQNAPPEVVLSVERMRPEKKYDNVEDVVEAIEKVLARRRKKAA